MTKSTCKEDNFKIFCSRVTVEPKTPLKFEKSGLWDPSVDISGGNCADGRNAACGNIMLSVVSQVD
jgi:hypothetical protein